MDEDLVICPEKSFAYFNGVPKAILYDNMKLAVIKRDAYGNRHHKFNNRIIECSKLYGFEIKLCHSYGTKSKAKVGKPG